MIKGTRNESKWHQRQCPQCEQWFECRIRSTQIYCSGPCRSRGVSPKQPDTRLTTNCPACGKQFEYHRSWPRKYCSNTCKGQSTIANIPQFKPSAFETTCEQCGKAFTTTPASTRGRFCSLPCWKQWVRENPTVSPRKGVKLGRPAHLPPLPTKTCLICGKEFSVKPSHLTKRVCCSRQCMTKLYSESGRYAGEQNFNWKGGYEPYYGPSWRTAQRKARERDRVCQGCGVTPETLGKALDVHHRKPFRTFGLERHAEANRLENLVSLCPACHKEWEHRGEPDSHEQDEQEQLEHVPTPY